MLCILAVFLGLHFYAGASWAAPIMMNEIQELDFGEFALRNNTAPHTITVAPDNSTVYDPDIISNIDAQRGEYEFSNLPPNVIFYVGISVPNPPTEGGLILDNPSNLTHGGGESFTLGNLTANDLVTDGAGDGTLYIGATLTTSGNSNTYADGNYNGSFDLTLYY